MRYNIPTYEEALEIVKVKGDLIFYENKYEIDGYSVSVFNYRLANYNDFFNIIEGNDLDAKEMRGLTFIFNSDGSLYKRYIMLQKFWKNSKKYCI